MLIPVGKLIKPKKDYWPAWAVTYRKIVFAAFNLRPEAWDWILAGRLRIFEGCMAYRGLPRGAERKSEIRKAKRAGWQVTKCAAKLRP